MRIIAGAVVAAVPLLLLDSLFFGGVYTHTLMQMLAEISAHLAHG